MRKNNSLQHINQVLDKVDCGTPPPRFLFLTGSSGCGKTYLVEALARELDAAKVAIYYFDRIGIPPQDQMIAECGSIERWQEKATFEWMKRLAQIDDKALVIFEGQCNPQFIIDGAAAAGIENYKIAVIVADEKVWEARLRGPRGQAFLVNEDMRNWARFLRERTVALGGAIIDTSDSDLDKNIGDVAAMVETLF
jgi:energy-coupling factor transporter ATP-binding protein EcfA2